MTTWVEVASSAIAFIAIVLFYGLGLGIAGSLAYLVFSYFTGVTL